jgi:hypothetical protein
MSAPISLPFVLMMSPLLAKLTIYLFESPFHKENTRASLTGLVRQVLAPLHVQILPDRHPPAPDYELLWTAQP